jgi:hypothetical protein
MKHPFNFLPLVNGANLIFTPCPGTKDVGLQQSLEQLAAAGASAILTLMPTAEMQRNAVVDMPELCEQLGLKWFHLPIEDDHAPEQEFTAAWNVTKEKVHALLNSGKSIAIHCKGGSGRTGLVQRRFYWNAICHWMKSLNVCVLFVPMRYKFLHIKSIYRQLHNTLLKPLNKPLRSYP